MTSLEVIGHHVVACPVIPLGASGRGDGRAKARLSGRWGAGQVTYCGVSGLALNARELDR
jgi:hypothetical protein